jgi:molybdopterin-guanine dinucleotide biosynthesis protein A
MKRAAGAAPPGAAPGRTAGLILCGGRSSRMGVDKALLRIGPRTLLDLALEHMGQVAAPVVLSITARQDPPRGYERLEWVRDEQADQGPLFGMARGFRALTGRAERVVVMPVDMPFLTGPWLARLVAGLAGHQACLFRWQGFTNALTAAYALALLPRLEALIQEGRRRPIALIEGVPTRVLEIEGDAERQSGPPSMMDTDTPADYREALRLAGFGSAGGVPVWVSLPTEGGLVQLPLFAATAGEALDYIGAVYPEHGAADGHPAPRLWRGSGGARAPLRPADSLVAEERLDCALS